MRSNTNEDLRRGGRRLKNRNYLPAIIILGLASTILIYLLTMERMGWQTPKIPTDPKATALLVSGRGQISGEIILYASPNTQAYFAKIGGNYDVLLNPWRKYLESRKADFQEKGDVLNLSSISRGTLILPSAIALDEAERSAILKFREQGGSVLATWASGSRTGQGEWAGWDFLASLGSKVVGEIPSEPISGHLILNGESPVSHTHPAGLRIWLGKPAERHLRLQLQDEHSQVAARIMNWARIPVRELYKDAALIFSEQPGKGRTAVFGFAESAWDASEMNIYTLLDDTFNWLARRPAIIFAKWPSGYRSAQLIEMDTEEGFSNALGLAASMNAANLRGSFYVLSSEAKKHPDVLKALGRDFEIGLHGDIHVGFKDQSTTEQQKRIETMVGELASIYPDIRLATGFRAPTEGYDQTTEKLLVQNGFSYHVADPSRGEARLPILVKEQNDTGQNALVVLPRTQRDDINIAQEASTVEEWENLLDMDAELSRNMGGLGLLSVHSQNYASGHPLTIAMPKFLNGISKKTDVWIASGKQLAEWWKERERFKLSAKQVGVRIEFDISIIGNKPFQNGALVVMLPNLKSKAVVEGMKSQMPKFKTKSLDSYRTIIFFDELPPGNYQYQIVFNEK